jgi:glycosyltransferase involved in cell wall biosynthesis
MKTLPISLALFVKNESKNIADCVESIRPVVREIVIVDTGSEDNTIQLCKKYTNRVYQIPFIDFGNIRTITAHLATQPWVLMLDADERILHDDWLRFAELIDQPVAVDEKGELDVDGNIIIDSWALPRKRWSDRFMTKQVEPESYPDWQVRLFRNHPDRRIKFVRRVHETISGAVRTELAMKGPVIQHIQGIYKTEEQKQERALMYKRLYEQDLAEGILHTEPPVVAIDDVEVK